jgi:hypothetical protein
MDKNILLSFIVFVTLFLSCNSTPVNPESENLGDLIDIILAKLDTYFVQKDVNYTPPFKWAEKAGLYRSNIRINLVGDPIMQDLRNGELTSIFDNDMFSTGWIVTTLLDAILYGKAVAPFAPRDLNMSLIAMNDFKNRNEKNVNQTIIRTFWPQTYNSTYNIWQQQPINIRNVILNVEALPWDAIEKFLKSIKLNKLVDWCEQIRQMGKEGLDAFSIPPDFGN